MGINQRRHYRTDGRMLGGGSTEVVAGGVRQKVTLIDISASGAAIAFSGMTIEEVESFLKSSLASPQLIIESRKLRNPLRLPFRAVHTSALPYGTGVGLTFRAQVRSDERMTDAMQRIFNRRQAVRVDCDLTRPIIVAVRDDQGVEVCRAILKDLSVSGVGLYGRPEDAERIQRDKTYRFLFILDGREMDVTGDVRSEPRSLTLPAKDRPGTVDVIRYGAELCDRDRRRSGVSVPITSFVMKRQLDIRRAHVDPAAPSAEA